jgi:hypothetical protein
VVGLNSSQRDDLPAHSDLQRSPHAVYAKNGGAFCIVSRNNSGCDSRTVIRLTLSPQELKLTMAHQQQIRRICFTVVNSRRPLFLRSALRVRRSEASSSLWSILLGRSTTESLVLDCRHRGWRSRWCRRRSGRNRLRSRGHHYGADWISRRRVHGWSWWNDRMHERQWRWREGRGDYQTSKTVQRSANFKTEGEARATIDLESDETAWPTSPRNLAGSIAATRRHVSSPGGMAIPIWP